MKSAIVLSIFAMLTASAEPLTVDPIPIIGIGSYGCLSPDVCFLGGSFSGSDGIDSVSLSARGDAEDGFGYSGPYGTEGTVKEFQSAGNTPPGLAGAALVGTVFIDRIGGDHAEFRVSVGSGNNFLTIYDSLFSVILATAILGSEIVTTSYSRPDPSQSFDESGAFAIVPEPNPFLILLVGAFVLGMSQRVCTTKCLSRVQTGS